MRKSHWWLAAVAAVLASAGCKKKNDDANKTTEVPVAHDGATAAVPVDATEPAKPDKKIVTRLPSDLTWVAFDDKAGIDKSGGYAVLWGDPQSGPAGLMIKLPARSPGTPHMHTNAYHGVSLAGAIAHQQDARINANPLPPGSYWFEPAGAPHVSSCPGKEPCLALVHFNTGKFDVIPAKLTARERAPVDYVEQQAADIKLGPLSADKGSPQVSTVWSGDALRAKPPDNQIGAHGTFWKLAAGFTSPPHTHTADYHAVVIKGTVLNYTPDDKTPKELGPGSYYMQPGGLAHITACKAGAECLMYSYMIDKFDFQPAAGDAPAAGSAAGSATAGSAAK